MLFNQALNLSNLNRLESAADLEANRAQPELRSVLISFDVNMLAVPQRRLSRRRSGKGQPAAPSASFYPTRGQHHDEITGGFVEP